MSGIRQDSENMQEAVIAFLSDPASYGALAAGADRVERIETHGAIVFLVGRLAFKMKKAVRFGYMDFSSLEKRHAACLAELRLNRRTAPMLYRGLAAVTRAANGRLALDGGGEPIEWLVAMNRFDQEARCDRLAASGRLDDALIDALAEAVAAFHAGAERHGEAGGAAECARVIRSNAAEMERHAPALFAPAAVARLREAGLAALARQRDLIETRRQAGFVRHCHGDLHLCNICLIEGRPVLFDGIEFDDRLARIDILYDLAFLLMDLCERGLQPAANRVLNFYLVRLPWQEGEDCTAALALLPLFLSMRAAVRAHVSAAMGLEEPARRYFAAAERFLMPPPPCLIAVGGLSGSGKTTLARALAPRRGPAPGALVLRSDELRKALFGLAPQTRLAPEAYGSEVTRRVYAAMRERARHALVAGHAVILDAVFAREEERAAAAALARDCGVPFAGIWLEAPPERMARRLTMRQGDASDADADVLAAQLGYDLGALSWHRLDAAASAAVVLAGAEAVLDGLDLPAAGPMPAPA